MKKHLLSVLCLLLTVLTTLPCQAQPLFFTQKMVDLTHSLEEGIPQFSDDLPFHLNKLTDYKSGYLSYAFSIPEHIGTHVDAPRHFFEDRRSLENIPPEDFLASAVVINVIENVRKNPDYEFTTDDLRKWEMKHGPVTRDSVVILRTGWESKWFRPHEYLGRDRDGVFHFPGFSCGIVEYLAHNRSVRALGTDTLSIDPGRSKDFCAHRILLNADKYAVEGLTNLEKLPDRGATIFIAPLKIKGGSGAPARVLAWMP